jgi:hypothetical protein
LWAGTFPPEARPPPSRRSASLALAPLRTADLTCRMYPAGAEMDAGPIPVGLKHRESYCIPPGAEGPTDQTFAVFDAPKTVMTPRNIEMMRVGRSPGGEGCRRAFH